MRIHSPGIDPDGTIDESVRVQIREHTNGLIHGLQVNVTTEHVILTGRTSSYYAKQLASHAAMNVLGEVLELTNNIEVV